MVLQGPYATTTAAADGPKLGDCIYDTLTVTMKYLPPPQDQQVPMGLVQVQMLQIPILGEFRSISSFY